jgi:hypothetical protein
LRTGKLSADKTRLGEPLEEGGHLTSGHEVLGAVTVVHGRITALGDPVVVHPVDGIDEGVIIWDVDEMRRGCDRDRRCQENGCGSPDDDERVSSQVSLLGCFEPTRLDCVVLLSVGGKNG